MQLQGMQTEVEERALRERRSLPLAGKVQASDLDNASLARAEGAVAEPGTAAIPMLVANLLTRQARYGDAQTRLQSVPSKVTGDREIRRLRRHLRLIRAAAGSKAEERLAAPLEADPDGQDSRFAPAARRLLDDDSEVASAALSELPGRAPGWRSGAAARAQRAVAEVLGADDERVRQLRHRLVDRMMRQDCAEAR